MTAWAKPARETWSGAGDFGECGFVEGEINLKLLRGIEEGGFAAARGDCAGHLARGNYGCRGGRNRWARAPQEVMAALAPYCAAFLCTDVDREGDDDRRESEMVSIFAGSDGTIRSFAAGWN